MTDTKARSTLVESCSRLLFRHLEQSDDFLLLTTSNRYREHMRDVLQSTRLALRIRAGSFLMRKKTASAIEEFEDPLRSERASPRVGPPRRDGTAPPQSQTGAGRPSRIQTM
jgi:hypothetical protein